MDRPRINIPDSKEVRGPEIRSPLQPSNHAQQPNTSSRYTHQRPPINVLLLRQGTHHHQPRRHETAAAIARVDALFSRPPPTAGGEARPAMIGTARDRAQTDLAGVGAHFDGVCEEMTANL